MLIVSCNFVIQALNCCCNTVFSPRNVVFSARNAVFSPRNAVFSARNASSSSSNDNPSYIFGSRFFVVGRFDPDPGRIIVLLLNVIRVYRVCI